MIHLWNACLCMVRMFVHTSHPISWNVITFIFSSSNACIANTTISHSLYCVHFVRWIKCNHPERDGYRYPQIIDLIKQWVIFITMPNVKWSAIHLSWYAFLPVCYTWLSHIPVLSNVSFFCLGNASRMIECVCRFPLPAYLSPTAWYPIPSCHKPVYIYICCQSMVKAV